MDNRITVQGLPFVPYLKKDEIIKQVKRVAEEITRDLKGKKPVFICVLNGAFMFAADLLRCIDINDCKIHFVKYKSYEGTQSSGKVKQVVGLNDDITGEDVVIIEDIVDTGLTAASLINDIKAKGPASVKFATLLYKPDNIRNGFKPDYMAFSIPPKFIIGYGLDLDGKARNLEDIFVNAEE